MILTKIIAYMRATPRRWRNNYWKQRFAVCGDNLQVMGRVNVTKPQNIHIGDNCNLNEGARLICAEGSTIQLGNNVTLSPGASVISTGYDIDIWEKDTSVRKHISAENIIGDSVWLCTNSIVLPGVKILGNHVILAAGGY